MIEFCFNTMIIGVSVAVIVRRYSCEDIYIYDCKIEMTTGTVHMDVKKIYPPGQELYSRYTAKLSNKSRGCTATDDA